MNELISRSATAMAQAIRDRAVSSVELVRASLDRIEQVNPALNAVVQVCAERALAEAERADQALARGDVRGPLHGVPITLKDSHDTEGVITTGGTMGRASHVPTRDSTVCARMRGAGAILLGKTNTPELTLAGETDNLIYGRTNNPYDTARSPGGSSGGAAAIIAACGAPLDLGSDTAGSIRYPAHFCGIAGIKPTVGRVPRTGHIIPHGLGALDGYTQIGPMARYVDDLTLTLPIIAGPDGCDPTIAPVPLGAPGDVDVRSLRVAYYTELTNAVPVADIASAVTAAAAALADAGADVRDHRPEALNSSAELGFALLQADGRAWIQRLLDRAGTEQVTPRLARRLAMTEPVTAPMFSAMIEAVDAFRRHMLQFMASYDAIIAPIAGIVAFPHGTIDDRVNQGAFRFAVPYNMTGWPTAAIRAGMSDGLPVGVQIVGRPWREDVCLAIARHLETALGGWQPPDLI